MAKKPLLAVAHVRAALNEAHQSATWRQIAEGAGVNQEWLRKVADGRIQGPSLPRVERLMRYLGQWK